MGTHPSSNLKQQVSMNRVHQDPIVLLGRVEPNTTGNLLWRFQIGEDVQRDGRSLEPSNTQTSYLFEWPHIDALERLDVPGLLQRLQGSPENRSRHHVLTDLTSNGLRADPFTNISARASEERRSRVTLVPCIRHAFQHNHLVVGQSRLPAMIMISAYKRFITRLRLTSSRRSRHANGK